MSRNFSPAALLEGLRGPGKNPRVLARMSLGLLVAANLIAAAIVLKPWAGSAEDLERQAAALRQDVRTKQIALGKLRTIVNKVESARTDGDRFMDDYLLGRRWVSSMLLDEMGTMARKAGIRQKEVTFTFEPVEGSDTLTKAVITAAYEGTYADLIHFVNLLDHSPRLLIVESLSATPQPQGAVLGVSVRLNAFVREGGSAPARLAGVSELASAEPGAPPAPPAAPVQVVQPSPGPVQVAPGISAPGFRPGTRFAPVPVTRRAGAQGRTQ